MAHTPGPWFISEDPYIHVRQGTGEDNRGSCVLARDYCSLADARLIAAAPDLLAALEMLWANCIPAEQNAVGRIALDAARAAILKAKGESP